MRLLAVRNGQDGALLVFDGRVCARKHGGGQMRGSRQNIATNKRGCDHFWMDVFGVTTCHFMQLTDSLICCRDERSCAASEISNPKVRDILCLSQIGRASC